MLLLMYFYLSYQKYFMNIYILIVAKLVWTLKAVLVDIDHYETEENYEVMQTGMTANTHKKL